MLNQIYAIVDIETTGGYAAAHGITEVSIHVHNGVRVIDCFESLINPQQSIPRYIQALTGITDDLVANAPVFEEIAEELFQLLNGKIFVAHNVNFDYSFIKHHLQASGYQFQDAKLCTVRLSKKVFPGLPSYSLGNLCRSLEIKINNRHRAGGDAEATVKVFEKILSNGGQKFIEQSLKRGSKEQYLPLHLDKEEIDKLPYSPGVYYFHDKKGKVIYVGKAKNLKYRVRSHFSHNGSGRQKQEFMRNIYKISFKECATELMAAILEVSEIRRLWPKYNTSQKRIEFQYALYCFEDRKGYKRLAIERKKKHLDPVYTFGLMWEGHRLLNQLIEEYELSPYLCYIDKTKGTTAEKLNIPKPGVYNKRVDKALKSINKQLPTYALLDKGINGEEKSCILIEKGKFYGMGYLPSEMKMSSLKRIRDLLNQYPDNDFIRGLVERHVELFPEKMIEL